ncbi:hypothetical protein [Vulcanisaeta thermophila]|uniref:hypothetical protein n=1 Tax=Vulcanisaeta thermophila TaxID=867917 RepID=UPI000852AF76|nr:hypothetical protein [Vulcanisaeta thermophila]
MAFFSNPIKALLTDVVPTKYVSSLFQSLNCGSVNEDYPVITLGSGGRKALVVTGFNVLDFKITNTLIHMAMTKCMGTTYSIPTFSNSQLSKWVVKIVPMANPWPYNSWDVIKGVRELYGVDENGIEVMHDALTLISKYSVKLHELVNNLRPNLIITLWLGDKLSITTPGIARVGNYPQVPPDPTDFRQHFMLEGYLELSVSIPHDWGPRDIAKLVIDLIREYTVNWAEAKALEAVVRIGGDVDSVLSTLRIHGIEARPEGDYFVLSVKHSPHHLLNLLIDNNLLEHYFNVDIFEIRLPTP